MVVRRWQFGLLALLFAVTALLFTSWNATPAHAQGVAPDYPALPASAGAVPRDTGRTPRLNGPTLNMMAPNALAYRFTIDGTNDIVTLDVNAPATQNVLAPTTGRQFFAGDFAGNNLTESYMIDAASQALYRVNATTGVQTLVGPVTGQTSGHTASGMAWDYATGQMYIASTSCAASSIGILNLTTGAVTGVVPVTNAACLIDIGIHPQTGQMYGVDIISDNTVSINKTTGVGTVLGPTGIDANFAQGMDFDPASGVLYYAAFNNGTFNGEMRTVNLTTGATTLIGNFGGTTTEIDALSIQTTSGTPTPTPTGTLPTATPTNTATPTATPQTGNYICSTAPLLIPDNLPAGANQTISVSTAGTISDLNIVVTGTHTWVGDVALSISNGTDTVLFFDRPGVPASTFGCSSDNLPGVVADDEGSAGSFENTCLSPIAYTPGGHYTPNNPLSVFDGDPIAGTWTLNASDAAGGDSGTIQQWCLQFNDAGEPTPTPTATTGPAPDINVTPNAFVENHATAGQTTQDTMVIQNTGSAPLTWTITEEDTRPWSNPNPPAPRNENAPIHRLGIATGGATEKVEAGPIVGDGSFETGSPNAVWEEFSANFGTPLCTVALCGQGGGTGPRTGQWWAWFGGTTAAETGAVTQTVTIPSGSAELSFWLEIPAIATTANGFLSVRMDGTEVFRAEENTPGYATYAEVTVDVSAHAGGDVELSFFSQTDAASDVTNFFVDDVAITVTGPGACDATSNIPWLTVAPLNGTTAASGSTNVTLTYNSTGLTNGTYTGNVCIDSNDPDESTVVVPVTLNVGPPTAVDVSSFSAPLNGINIADLAAAGLLLLAGAVLVLRRR